MTELFPKSMSVKQAVVATLAYFDLFEVPLTREEISEYLFFLEPDEKKIDIYLKESPLINHQDGYFSLRNDTDFFRKFQVKKERSKKYWKKIRRYQWLFAICPFVKTVLVCNSLPIRDTREKSDIDLLVITDVNHLFTARYTLTALTQLFGVRRHGRKTSKRFCLSFYITDHSLDLSEIAQQPYDIYLAYWLKTLEPISGDYEIYEKLHYLNQKWLNRYFKRSPKHKRRFRKTSPWQKKIKRLLESLLNSPKLEHKLKLKQLESIHQKRSKLEDESGTIINNRMLKFHDKDIREQVKKAWEALITELL